MLPQLLDEARYLLNVAEIERGTIDNRFAYAPAIALGAIAAALGW